MATRGKRKPSGHLLNGEIVAHTINDDTIDAHDDHNHSHINIKHHLTVTLRTFFCLSAAHAQVFSSCISTTFSYTIFSHTTRETALLAD